MARLIRLISIDPVPFRRPFLGSSARHSISVQRANPAAALRLIESAKVYERAARFWPAYLRGQALLQLKRASEASREFQRILDHRGEDPLSPIYTLASLGLGRAAALAGDRAKSRQAYRDFFTRWKDADRDLPILVAAKKEYATAVK